ncbi:MAG: hypothetical protein R3261_13070 [Alphaproteobacteria bacterium]|nr:hypothetical protein [Alphaproteobacteria bacterium]
MANENDKKNEETPKSEDGYSTDFRLTVILVNLAVAAAIFLIDYRPYLMSALWIALVVVGVLTQRQLTFARLKKLESEKQAAKD